MESDERLLIETPEQIGLEVSIAGLGSRFLATAVDTLLQGVIILAALIVLAFASSTRILSSAFAAVGPPLAIFTFFIVYWGYFAAFETLWDGRTPGKRVAGIRVMDLSGRPVNALAAITRNVLRVIDFLPVFYGLGAVVMMLNRQSRRLGDFVAGTIVVHEQSTAEARPIWTADDEPGQTTDVESLSAEELTLIETYLHRRFDLGEIVRDDLAQQITERIIKKTGLRPDPNEATDEFLGRVARRVRDLGRFRGR